MKKTSVPKSDHVVRYLSPNKIEDDGSVAFRAFLVRVGETGLSVNWLECLSGMNKQSRLSEVRRVSRLEVKPTGGYAEMHVGKIFKKLSEVVSDLDVVHAPLDEEDEWPPDPSHCEIRGLPSDTDGRARRAAERLADCVCTIHPAVES